MWNKRIPSFNLARDPEVNLSCGEISVSYTLPPPSTITGILLKVESGLIVWCCFSNE
ncbi:MAG: CRISPR-associated protein Cas5 [Saprospiraceae bacterium]|nr:CRISPR-associated protein Cas5 [Saprospiraceae bacterium]